MSAISRVILLRLCLVLPNPNNFTLAVATRMPHPQPDFSRESYWHRTRPNWTVIGLDEAGRGPWAGPVVAGAAWIDPKARLDVPRGIGDSKTLTPKCREQLYETLVAQSEAGGGVRVATGSASHQVIDDLGIIAATTQAMREAWQNLTLPVPIHQTHPHPQNQNPNKNLGKTKGTVFLLDGPLALRVADETDDATIIDPQTGGDKRILSIAIASIIAKVVRDHHMCTLAKEYPQYGWENNKGYGTAAHAQALARHGVSPYHRKSFRPCADMCYNGRGKSKSVGTK